MKYFMPRIGKLHLLSLIIMLEAFVINPAWAQTNSIASAPSKVIAVIPYDSPPTYFLDKKTGKPAGFAVDAMDAIAARAGFEIKYIFAKDWTEAVNKIVRGEADLSPDIGISEERERQLIYTSPLDTFPVSFFVRATSENKIKDGYNVGVIRGSIAHEHLLKRPNVSPVLYESFQHGLFDLLAGEIDAFACPAPTFLRLAQESGVEDKIKTAGEPLAEIKRAIALRRDNVRLLGIINKAMKDFVGQPEYQRIYLKWYGKPTHYMTPRRIATVGVITVFVLLGGMLVFRHITILGFNRTLKAEIGRRRQAEEGLKRAHEVLEHKVVERTAELGAANQELELKLEELRLMEKTLRQSEEKFRTLFESAVDGLFIVDLEGKFINVNRTAYERLGYTREEMLSMHLTDLDSPEFAVMLPQRYEQLEKHGMGVFESAHKRKDGTVMPVEINARLTDFEGKKVFFSIIRDITERQRAAEALRKSEERYHLLFDQSPDGILLIDTSGQMIEFNEMAHRQLGYSREEFAGLRLSEIDPVEDPEEIRSSIGKILEHGKAEFDVKHRTKQGEIRDVHIITQVIMLSGSQVLHAIWQDITDRKLAEEKLRTSEERYRLLFNYNPLPMWIYDVETLRFMVVNEAALSHYGYSREDFLSMTLKDIRPPEDVPVLLDAVTSSSQGLSSAGIWRHRKKDGTIIWVEIFSHGMLYEGHSARLVLTNDITSRKRAEEQIRESLGEKEILLKEIHHRVKNNLQVVASMLALQAAAIRDKEAKIAFEESQRRIEAMSLIHQKLYSSPELARVDFREYVDNLTSNLFALNEGRSARINLKTDIQVPVLDVNRAIPCGLIINELISNVLRHAFPEGREGSVFLGMYGDVKGDTSLIVSDNGTGVPEDLDFRNTKSLGLQLVIALVRQLNGTIELERDKGTSFKIQFPGTDNG